MGKGKPATPERKAYLNQLKRRYKLERKLEGGSLTEAERTELDRLPKRKPGIGRPRTLHSRGLEPEGADSGAEPTPTPSDGEPVESPPPVSHPPPDPPPAVEVMPRASSDWRSKFRQSMGREGTCVQIGMMYCALLKRMSAYVAAEGGRPVFDASAIEELVLPCAVLTVDALLPADFSITPEVEVTIYSGVIVGQAAMTALKARKRNGVGSTTGSFGAARVHVRPPSAPPPPNGQAAEPAIPDPAKPVPPPPTNVKIDDDSIF